MALHRFQPFLAVDHETPVRALLIPHAHKKFMKCLLSRTEILALLNRKIEVLQARLVTFYHIRSPETLQTDITPEKTPCHKPLVRSNHSLVAGGPTQRFLDQHCSPIECSALFQPKSSPITLFSAPSLPPPFSLAPEPCLPCGPVDPRRPSVHPIRSYTPGVTAEKLIRNHGRYLCQPISRAQQEGPVAIGRGSAKSYPSQREDLRSDFVYFRPSQDE